MSVRPPSELRVVADRLAQAFNSPSGAQAIALLQLLGMGSRQHVRMETASEGTSAPPDILGIWQRQAENGAVVFRRSPRLKHRWRHWADLESFMQHTSRKRVLFVGESVARGHFYDPYYTPSLVLESLLRTTPQLADVEVLDLASCG
ncbi:MAG: hypothetical protein ACREA0_20015, partial [bacterium]